MVRGLIVNDHGMVGSAVVECLTQDGGGPGIEPHRRHCVVCFSKNIIPSLVLVQPRKTCPFITEIVDGTRESNQTKQKFHNYKLW